MSLPLAFDHRRVGPSGPPMVGYLYASRLLITSLGSGLGPSRLGFTVTSLGSWPPAQPTRTHDHVPRLRASGPADSDPKSRPSAPGLVPSRLGLTRHPLTPAQIGHVMLGDTGTRPLPAAPSGGIPRSRLGLACLWRTPHSPPRRLGLLAPRRAARGASGPPRRIRLSRGPGLRAHPVLTPIRLRPIVQGHPPPSGRYLENMVRTTWTPARLYASEPPHPG